LNVVVPLLTALYLLTLLGVTGISVLTVILMLYSWRTPAAHEASGFVLDPQAPEMSFSLIVPARHEEAVLGATLAGLAALSHPDYEVIVVVGHDDPETTAVAREWSLRRPDIFRVVIDQNWPKTKPRALNTALPLCTRAVIGVFDAEDEVHPDLLSFVDTYLSTSGADICQSGIQLMNYSSSWWALRNCLEYFFHFHSRVHIYSNAGVLPLGGNTMFVRTDLVRREGGWDPDCLAEDCELGIRLSSHGAQTVVAYASRLATREETPPTLAALIRQRTRWDQGFLQVLKNRDWVGLPTRSQRLFAKVILATPILQAGTAVLVPASLAAMFWLRLSVLLSLLTFSVLASALTILAVDIVGFREFCRSFHFRPRIIDYVRLVCGAPFYQLVLAVAAVHAIIRQRRGIYNWVKTDHSGVHFSTPPEVRPPEVRGRGPRLLEPAARSLEPVTSFDQ
jgi:cellulose synthase/poly-beta-1,6-N-acetylglucosamine synthase-like glycosyltransferase